MVFGAWLEEAAATIEREQMVVSEGVGELAFRLERLARRLRPARRLLGSPLAAEGFRWTLRRLLGKPFGRH